MLPPYQKINIDSQNSKDFAQMANELRFLCADMVQNANSGHPGAPLGLADIAVILSQYLRINPANVKWLNRDRVVFSGGHASSLVYALLHLWGFDVCLEDLKNFRKLDSKTPGHPEFGHTAGVEITTGPLGQGIANAVGFALGAKYAQNVLGDGVINHKVFCFCGDGDLQEGISYEAASVAGNANLDNLIIIYDSNNISIEGAVDSVFSDDVAARFRAQNFEVLACDGHNFQSINDALFSALSATKPVIIIAKTIIAKNAIGCENSHKFHGAPLGEQAILESKKALGLSIKTFEVSEFTRLRFANVLELGELYERQWDKALDSQTRAKIQNFQNPNFENINFPRFNIGDKIATRVSNGQILNAIAQNVAGFLGGSADLAPSNNTELKNMGDFPNGKNMHFGIREHAMGGICNGLANYGLFMPFCATFFVFSDYLAPSIRVASLMKSRVFYIFTHDCIGVGEDGATHQPIEQLSHFRAMPNLCVFRPSCANENVACWQVALQLNTPVAFVLSRQNLEVLTDSENLRQKVAKGAYILKDCKNSQKPQITLLASGSEVKLALDSQKLLEAQNIAVRVVSAPSFDLLNMQDESYIKELFCESKVLAIEAARALEWYKFAHRVLGMDSFGASGKGEELFKKFGFSPENVAQIAKELLDSEKVAKC